MDVAAYRRNVVSLLLTGEIPEVDDEGNEIEYEDVVTDGAARIPRAGVDEDEPEPIVRRPKPSGKMGRQMEAMRAFEAMITKQVDTES